MSEFVKTKKDWDCRAVKEAFFSKFMPDKVYSRFIDLVRNNEDLAFCFRGNADSPYASVYRNNHELFKVSSETVYFNPNYLRYSPNWKEYLEELYNYGYGKGKRIYLSEIRRSVSKRGKVSYSCEFKNNTFSIPAPKVINDLDKIYNILSVIFDEFFSHAEEYKVDQFLLEKMEGMPEYKDEIEKYINENSKALKLEKIRQQQLFKSMKQQKNGYFFYDMEFEQKHMSKDEKKQDREEGKSNKPDMLAIRFGEDGEPKALVFVEVKCTESAYGGKSGLKKHITSMNKYPKDFFVNRRREAYLLLHQYQELGLISLDREIMVSEYEKLPIEMALVFTDEAIKKWETDESEESKMIRKQQNNGIGIRIEFDSGKYGILAKTEMASNACCK